MKRKQKTLVDKLRLLPLAVVLPVVVLVILWASQVRSGRQPMPPELSVAPGFYEDPFDLTLNPAAPGDVVRYTLDGAIPTSANSQVYDGPIRVASTTVLRAAAFRSAATPSAAATATYLFLDDVARQPESPDGLPERWGETRAAYGMDSGVAVPPLRYIDSVKSALRSLPTLSIVTDAEGLFGAAASIYANPTERGLGWERAASVEYFGSDGILRFHENCGLRIFGHGDLDMDTFPKRSLRLLFRSRHGAPRLRYPLFGGTAAETLNTVALRCVGQDSWHSQRAEMREAATYIRDQFVRELQSTLGHPAFHGAFVHVYLNGLYWGVYNMCEWSDAAFAAEYLGGNKGQYDVLKDREAVDGTMAAWREVESLAAGNLEEESTYRGIQAFVDLDNLIDYLILNHYVANLDWTESNWVAVRKREAGAQFVFLAWDSEVILRNVEREWQCPSYYVEQPQLGPRTLGERLMRNEAFRRRFADRVQALFFNDGPLTPEAATRSWRSVAAQVDSAIVAESARWGHYHGGKRYTREADWLREIAWVEESFLPYRRDILVDQYRKAGVFNASGAHPSPGGPEGGT